MTFSNENLNCHQVQYMHFYAVSLIGLKQITIAVTLILILVASSLAQDQPANPAREQSEEVIKVETILMQAGVTVLDKQGHFVDQLKPEQFEVFVDGKPQQIVFFDKVVAGSANEGEKIAIRKSAKPSIESSKVKNALPNEGRKVFFFLDDLHMSAESISRSRKAIEYFVNREMSQNDLVAIASASGQLGFLQQLTNNKTVLLAAASRLKPWSQMSGDGQLPTMTEYTAQTIAVEADRDLIDTYVQPLMRDGMRRPAAETLVKERARLIVQTASAVTRNTLRSLSSLIRTLSPVTGRKLVFFFSDGFLLPRNESDIASALQDITDAAVRAGFVVYTMDARGLSVDAWADAASSLPADVTGQLTHALHREMSASQESLYLLAEQTGGRAILDTNSMTKPLSRVVNETGAYYVLAWQPTEVEQKGSKFHRLEVTLKERSDLIVLVQRGFREGVGEWVTRQKSDDKGKNKNAKTGTELSAALASAVPVRDLPVHLLLSYLNLQKNDMLMTAMFSMPLDALSFNQSNQGGLEVEGYVVNLDGKIGSRFKERLNITNTVQATPAKGNQTHILYRHQVKLAPGIYQVRVAALDASSQRIGSATEWIEIPDLKAGQFTLGSLLLGEPPTDASSPHTAENFVNQRSAELRFTRSTPLRFMTYIYNAAPSNQQSPPDLEVQIVVLRDNKPVLTDEWRKVDVASSDFGRIAYGAEISLETMSPGRHTLQITVNNRQSQVKTSQQANFVVE